jgi:GNAT superfamily N-acetyltransferase
MALIEEVQQEYVVRYGSPDETPLDPAMFEPPSGSFFVGYLSVDGGPDLPVASGAWRARTDVDALSSTRAAEIKRMYVAPSGRGQGLARAMLAHLEATALAAGAEVVILETGVKQPEAMALYESCGYVRIHDYGHYKCEPESRCYGRRLTRSAAS